MKTNKVKPVAMNKRVGQFRESQVDISTEEETAYFGSIEHADGRRRSQRSQRAAPSKTNEDQTQHVEPVVFKARSTLKASKKWRHYHRSTRTPRTILKHYETVNQSLSMQSGVNGHSNHNKLLCQDTYGFLDDQSESESSWHTKSNEGRKTKISSSGAADKALLHYFATLTKSKDKSKCVDFEFVLSLLKSGSDINYGDKYGQTVLHEIARTWHTDVAAFFIEHGSDVNKEDSYGRTPLHVASAVDYPKMVNFLIQNGADINARTKGEGQSPIHYAAKNDACKSLSELLRLGASIEDLDYKSRTPLQIAAELDRSETCYQLVDEGAPCGVTDSSSMSAISLMVNKMPSVALKALDQFHVTDRANRQQYFYLNFLESDPTSEGYAKSAFQEAVEQKQYTIITHPVFQRLTEVKWKSFARYGVWLYAIGNLFVCIAWTVLICLLPPEPKDIYTPLAKRWFRIVFEVIAVIGLMVWIKDEIKEYVRSKRHHDKYVHWREKELIRDLEYCHPRWPEERSYIEREIKALRNVPTNYLVDWWNYFDLVTYGFVIGVIVCHVVNVLKATSTTHKLESRLGAFTIFFLWIRLMKFVRAFRVLGPFVVMLQHVLLDSIKFGFLFFEFYIPYAAAFWAIFGVNNISGYSDPQSLFYNLLQMSVIGDYTYDSLTAFDKTMAQLFCGTYIVFSGIICLNLFIALLSDTFQRVHDNAKSTAIMLRAATILSLESDLPAKRFNEMKRRIHEKCAPEKQFYDDDVTSQSDADVRKMTYQIKESVDRIQDFVKQQEIRMENDKDSTTENNLTDLTSQIAVLQSNLETSISHINGKIDNLSTTFSMLLSEIEKEREEKRGKMRRKLERRKSELAAKVHLPKEFGYKSNLGNSSNVNRVVPEVRVIPIRKE